MCWQGLLNDNPQSNATIPTHNPRTQNPEP